MTNTFESEFDSFFNLDSAGYQATENVKPSLTQSSSSTGSVGPYPTSSHQAFSAPSYAYDSHRQQTGLPIGGLANTFAINQAAGLQYRPNSMGFVMPTETLNVPLTNNLDEYDFNQNMDFDADSPTDVHSARYSSAEASSSAPIQRMYPGMHSQQAAQAKAAQAQRQQDMNRENKPLPGQLSLPTQTPKAPAAKDPQVEESITRILSKMRQNSSASNDDGSSDPTSGMYGLPKTKREEDEMDEDERLLASEEGKKLSSKERRQLRNKVSARAFRSRRKEYIGQLEGELQTKAQEAHELRIHNQQLMEENTRLTDLTRMLLSSNAFAGFLQELSQSGGGPPPVAPTVAPPRPRTTPKDVSARATVPPVPSQNQQVGMTIIPEINVAMPGFETPHNQWVPTVANDFQVFAVTALPEPLDVDFASLDAKQSKPRVSASKQGPSLPERPSVWHSNLIDDTVRSTPKSSLGTHLDDSVQTDDLYAEATSSALPSINDGQELIRSLTKSSATAVAPPRGPIQPDSEGQALSKLCFELDEACARLNLLLR